MRTDVKNKWLSKERIIYDHLHKKKCMHMCTLVYLYIYTYTFYIVTNIIVYIVYLRIVIRRVGTSFFKYLFYF